MSGILKNYNFFLFFDKGILMNVSMSGRFEDVRGVKCFETLLRFCDMLIFMETAIEINDSLSKS